MGLLHQLYLAVAFGALFFVTFVACLWLVTRMVDARDERRMSGWPARVVAAVLITVSAAFAYLVIYGPGVEPDPCQHDRQGPHC